MKVLSRLILLILGCLPISYYYVQSSIVLLFGILIAGIYFGIKIVAGAVLLWLVVTTCLSILIICSATFNPSRRGLPAWQIIGLVGSLVCWIAVAYRFSHSGVWWICIASSLAYLASAFIFIFPYNNKIGKANKTEMATPRKPSDQFGS